MQFSNFQKLTEVTHLEISGELNREWNERYIRRGAVFVPDGTGSNLSLTNFKLSAPGVFANRVKHLAYILTSNRYPILYVGISGKGLSCLFSGNGRLAHHLRKVFAIPGNGGTNHTRGWRPHAVDRYNQVREVGDLARVADDLFFSIATHNSSLENHEGYIFNAALAEMGRRMAPDTILILNTRRMKCVRINVTLPENIASVWRPHARTLASRQIAAGDTRE